MKIKKILVIEVIFSKKENLTIKMKEILRERGILKGKRNRIGGQSAGNVEVQNITVLNVRP